MIPGSDSLLSNLLSAVAVLGLIFGGMGLQHWNARRVRHWHHPRHRRHP